MNADAKRDRHEQAVRRQLRNNNRPQPSYGTRRPILYGSASIEVTGRGSDRYICVVATVKTGSRRMFERFEKFANMNRVGFEPIGADENAGGESGERQTITRREANGRTVEQLGPDDSRTRSEFLLWGDGETLADFLERNTGDDKPIASWSFNVPVRVSSSSGAGKMERGSPVDGRVRDMLRGKTEREARFARREQDVKREVEREDRESRARGTAQRMLPLYVDVSPEGGLSDGAIAQMLDELTAFCRKFERPPETAREFHEWRLNR